MDPKQNAFLVRRPNQAVTPLNPPVTNPKFAAVVAQIHNLLQQFRAQNPGLYDDEMIKFMTFFQNQPEQVKNVEDEVQRMVGSIKNTEAQQKAAKDGNNRKSRRPVRMVDLETTATTLYNKALHYNQAGVPRVASCLARPMYHLQKHQLDIKRMDAIWEEARRDPKEHESVLTIQELDVEDLERMEELNLADHSNENLEVAPKKTVRFNVPDSPSYQGSGQTVENPRAPTAEELPRTGSEMQHLEELADCSVICETVILQESPAKVGQMEISVSPTHPSPDQNSSGNMERRAHSSSPVTSEAMPIQEEIQTEEQQLVQASSPQSHLDVDQMDVSGDAYLEKEPVRTFEYSDISCCESLADNTEVPAPPKVDEPNVVESPELPTEPSRLQMYINRESEESDGNDAAREKLKHKCEKALRKVGRVIYTSSSDEDEVEKVPSPVVVQKKVYLLKLNDKKTRRISAKMYERITRVGRKKFKDVKKIRKRPAQKKSLKKKESDSKSSKSEKAEKSESSVSSGPSDSSDEDYVGPSTRKKSNFGFLKKPVLRTRRFDDSPVKKRQGEVKKMTALEKQLKMDLKRKSLEPKNLRKRSYPEVKDYVGYEITGMKFENKHLTFDVKAPSLSGRTHAKKVWDLDDIPNAFETNIVEDFKKKNRAEFEDIYSEYLEMKKDEAEAAQKGVSIKVPSFITIEKHQKTKFTIKNLSKNHDIHYVVNHPDVLNMESDRGLIPKKSEVKLTAEFCSRRSLCDDLFVEYHWGKEGDAPRLSKKIRVVHK